MVNFVPWEALFFKGMTESPIENGQIWRDQTEGVILFTITNGPLHCIQGSLFHGITDDSAVIQLNECVGDGQRQDGLLSHFLHVNQTLAVGTATQSVEMDYTFRTRALPHAGNAFQNEICSRDRACLIETTDINSPCKRNPERFSAEDS